MDLNGKEGELLVKQNNKFGVINNKGVKLIGTKYDFISSDEYYSYNSDNNLSGYIIGEKTSTGYRYGYLKKNKQKLLDTQYNEIIRIGGIVNEDTDKNIFILATKNGQYGLIKNRKKVIDFKYQGLDYSGISNLFIAKRGSKYGVINSKGKKIIDFKFDDLYINEDYICAKQNEKDNYFDLKGKAIEPKSAEEKIDNEEDKEEEIKKVAELVNPNIVPKEKGGKWGFVDKNSKLVIDYKYDEVTEVNKYGFAGIKKNGKWGSIDEKGNVIQEPKYKLDELGDISFIGKYYKVVYDNKNIVYTDEEYIPQSEV